MPEKVHRELAAEARAKGLTGKRYNAYVYGTLAKIEKRHKAQSTDHMNRKS